MFDVHSSMANIVNRVGNQPTRGWNNSMEKNLSIVGLYSSLSENGRGASNEYVDSGGRE